VAQLHNEHLTTEQLSAFFDKQLSPQEQAVFDAHVSTCQQCQRNLADLRLTVSLLHAMPEQEVPHSFVLPGRLAPVPHRAARQDTTVTPVNQKQHARLNTLRRSVRVVSTLAAVLALIFIISGILPPLRFGGGESASAPVISRSSAGVSTADSANQTPNAHVTPTSNYRVQEGVATKTPAPVETPKAAPTTAAAANTGSSPPTDQTPPVPPVLDLGQPAGRLSLGVLLLALSIIGLIVTRRRRSTVS
jgi:anti-sigma factor RsiW